VLEGSNSVGHFHDRWTRRRRVVGCEWICARRLSFSGAQRGSSGTARAPGLASASMTTRLGFRWNAGDLVRAGHSVVPMYKILVTTEVN